ncbi:MAG: hypothetical protein PWQ51_545 [Methanolobus sp.]|jgi:hypothetical protein|uniref:Uncharacterized protein n=1 Tax=Methanolobus tindarius DSM 2278 TaxID=1090322 RepID=W9DR80_METTI|nr:MULTISPECIES: hypothetical protein [Methanolobus]ETA68005.1 hypothetical protein MettiDRAFT_1451 [Methanolobus tindarius DSM 2278]MDI3485865.1 hypothetical protein [Methanolobus sp.]MDK2832181.1 hypothetical protein [Methanolobus sp.]MDK2938381.1 hypothetical protein [Methanolobus sp.]
MVRIFKKQEDEKKELPHDGKVQLADASRRLGFEVGYHRHSEIGWVRDKLVQIYSFADQYDLNDFVKEHYNQGKEEGAKAKDRDTKSGLTRMANGKAEPEVPPNFTIERTKNEHSVPGKRSGFSNAEYDFSGPSEVTRQPRLVDLPDNIERAKVVERPSFLEGAKHLTPKKK